MAASNAAAARASVKNNRSEAFGIPSRKREGVAPNAPSGNVTPEDIQKYEDQKAAERKAEGLQ